MKLPVRIVCADVHFRGSLELCSYLVSKALTTFMHYVLQYPVTQVYNFGLVPFSWVAVVAKSTITLQYHFQLLLEYLGGEKFHELTCHSGVSYYNAMLKFTAHPFTNISKGRLIG